MKNINTILPYMWELNNYIKHSRDVDQPRMKYPTTYTNIGLFRINLCPISQDGLIIDWFNRENLYKIPCVPFLIFGDENYI